MPNLANLISYLQQQGGGDSDQLGEYIDMIRELTEQIDAGAPEQDPDWAWTRPAWQESIQGGMQSQGMGPAEYAQAKQQIVSGVGSMTGGTAADRARRGNVSRESMDQYMGGAPATAAAKGLAALEAKKEGMAREDRRRAQEALTGMMPFATSQAEAPQEAYGEMLGEYLGSQPQYNIGAMFSGRTAGRTNRFGDYNPFDAQSTSDMLRRSYSSFSGFGGF